MAYKLLIFSILVSLAIAHGAKISNKVNTGIVSKEKEGRLLEIPLLGLGLLIAKTSGLVLSKVLKLVGWKLAIVTLAATVGIKAVFWVLENYFSIILGAIGMFGFCKITGKCTLNQLPKGIVEVGEDLYYAAKNLDSGIELYGNRE